MPELVRRLLDEWQDGFPLVPEPWAEIADRLGTTGETLLAEVRRLHEAGTVSRVGPVFRPHTVGTSTLAAMAVPPERMEEVVALVNAHPEVNHNYEREHELNLWFVVTARDRQRLEEVLTSIWRESGIEVLDLPMLAHYHIDLGFRLK
ncbi:MAG: Lrp/AsnC family transcriptional regulator [Gammaproteobacteria bacterium]|nr:MAG: Lrp/AsnC family transcriptional regulator [Gammaproteobacteria bacterium]